MNRLILPYKILLSIIFLIYFIIFFGLITKGFVDLPTVFGFFGYFWILMYIALGAVVSTLVIMRFWTMWHTPASKLIEVWNRRKRLYIVSTLILIALYFVRHDLANLLLYAGFVVGRFFITASRQAYFSLLGLDLYQARIELFAWIFQWQFVYAVSESVAKIFRKKSRKEKS